MDWKRHATAYQNSVLHLTVTRGIYRADRPYKAPDDSVSSGTGFIIDIKNGWVLTNAHVVENAITITGRVAKLGKRDITLEVVGICRGKDLAMCKIKSEDMSLVTRGLDKNNITSLNMKFGDSLLVNETEEVMALGYPLGQENLKYTTGIVSGFHNHDRDEFEDVEDSFDRSPTYIQITAPINPGNSGGPLINKNGEVIGINAASYMLSQNVGYAIPSRTFLAIFSELSTKKVVKLPTLALKWNKTNRNIMEERTGDSKKYGIYVRKVGPDSCVDKLKNGDIITELLYKDPFIASKESLDIVNSRKTNNVEVICAIDRFGDFILFCYKDGDYRQLIDRKISLSEIMDMIPIGTPFSMKISRDRNHYKIDTIHQYVATKRIMRAYPRFEPYEYIIFGGICCAQLDIEHTEIFDNLSSRLNKENNKYRSQIVIVQVFPGTLASKTNVLKPGQIITKINSQTIKTVQNIKNILTKKPKNISIETENKCLFLIDTKQAISDDMNSMKNFSISTESYLLQ